MEKCNAVSALSDCRLRLLQWHDAHPSHRRHTTESPSIAGRRCVGDTCDVTVNIQCQRCRFESGRPPSRDMCSNGPKYQSFGNVGHHLAVIPLLLPI